MVCPVFVFSVIGKYKLCKILDLFKFFWRSSMVCLSFLGWYVRFFLPFLGWCLSRSKKHLAWKMLQRPHGLLHLFIFLRFLPVLVSVFFSDLFRRLRVFSLESSGPLIGLVFSFVVSLFGLIFETLKNGRGRKMLQRVHDLITSCFSRHFLGGARFWFSF